MPQRTLGVIVNADDLGESEPINTAILDALADGVISSSTILAVGPAVDAAIHATREFQAASFGVHMCLTDHRPLSGSPSLSPLLNDGGEFDRDAVYRVQWTKALVAAVVDEWIAQIRRVREGGVAISHLDSHHHVHTLPPLFFALKRVQKETGIRRVRGTWSVYDRASSPSIRLRLAKRAWWSALRLVHATTTTDEFSDFLMFQRAVADGSYAPRRWPRTIELMVHPNGNPAESGEEARVLRSGWMNNLPVSAELISYRNL
jgi:chitin disaccharide deacetylase